MVSGRIAAAVGVTLISLSAFVSSSSALASGPAAVTVRVEGATETLVAPTVVTTTTTPVIKDENPAHSCPGTSAAGALQLATSGNWNGAWFSGLDYSVEMIEGESHLFEPGVPANYFWSFWLDNKASSAGICLVELTQGESILFFPECFSESGACPTAPNPLGIVAPSSVQTGSRFTVQITSYDHATGSPSPAVEAIVSGGGVSAKTDSTGRAALSFSSAGIVTLHASAENSVRTEMNICVYGPSEGGCNAQAPGSAIGSGSSSSAGSGGSNLFGPPYKGPYAIVARATNLIEGHVYTRKGAPRVLAGSVQAHTAVASVSLKLRREYKGRCYAYNGTREEFVRDRCRGGRYFKVSTGPRFSYLLPSALLPGRYVLDIEATDAAGNHTSLARGTSRTVFYVH
jgi:hypothetical protein